ncbi:unnamed protein product [Acanthoscelides obtectus]|uniref:Uncharacterized protein n=1 Tax=Acanthoscelides obtectus TaxID=200917 RepID=A0A9P0KMB1_ACAOB|nr:unnamed protein product [Acanthoscelides obtectus]CAK1654662.1 hypothetical protein AOBTE_LOCUS18750 [Acanthoscelides obtectus]
MSDLELSTRDDRPHSVLDTERIITEVEKRHALYNKQLKEYSDRNLKEKLRRNTEKVKESEGLLRKGTCSPTKSEK